MSRGKRSRRSIPSRRSSASAATGWRRSPRIGAGRRREHDPRRRDGAREEGVAAIGIEARGELYGLHILFENIEDNPDNVTRFFVIGREPARKSGDDKTAIMFTTAHKPGALAEVLDVFKENGINLTDIEKRPSKKVNWEYYFFIDAQGHQDDAAMKRRSRRRSSIACN